jgi:hypothetical protein
MTVNFSLSPKKIALSSQNYRYSPHIHNPQSYISPRIPTKHLQTLLGHGMDGDGRSDHNTFNIIFNLLRGGVCVIVFCVVLQ